MSVAQSPEKMNGRQVEDRLVQNAAQDMLDDPRYADESAEQLHDELTTLHGELAECRPTLAKCYIQRSAWHAVAAAKEHMNGARMIRGFLPAYRVGRPLVAPEDLRSLTDLIGQSDFLHWYLTYAGSTPIIPGTRIDTMFRTMVQVDTLAMEELQRDAANDWRHPYGQLGRLYGAVYQDHIAAYDAHHKTPHSNQVTSDQEYVVKHDTSLTAVTLLTSDYICSGRIVPPDLSPAAKITKTLLWRTASIGTRTLFSRYETGQATKADLTEAVAGFSVNRLQEGAQALQAVWSPTCVGRIALRPREEDAADADELSELANSRLGITMPRGDNGEYSDVDLMLGPIGRYVARYTIHTVPLMA